MVAFGELFVSHYTKLERSMYVDMNLRLIVYSLLLLYGGCMVE